VRGPEQALTPQEEEETEERLRRIYTIETSRLIRVA